MSKVMITGVAGFIGMHTAIKFLERNISVVGIDNVNNYYSQDLKYDRLQNVERAAKSLRGEFEFYQLDLVDVDQYSNEIFDGIELVVHLAAQAGVRYSLQNPSAYVHSNILGFQVILENCANYSIPLLYASSSSVYGKTMSQPFKEDFACNTPESYYAATKKANELMAYSYYKTNGLRSLGLRFFTVYGPWGRPDMAPFIFTRAAFSNETINVFNNGDQWRDFTYVGDIVNSIWLLFSMRDNLQGADIMNIGNGSPVHLMEFIEMIENLTGLKLNKEYCEAQKGDVALTYADTTKLTSMIGESASTDLKEGLTKFINWYKDYYGIG